MSKGVGRSDVYSKSNSEFRSVKRITTVSGEQASICSLLIKILTKCEITVSTVLRLLPIISSSLCLQLAKYFSDGRRTLQLDVGWSCHLPGALKQHCSNLRLQVAPETPVLRIEYQLHPQTPQLLHLCKRVPDIIPAFIPVAICPSLTPVECIELLSESFLSRWERWRIAFDVPLKAKVRYLKNVLAEDIAMAGFKEVFVANMERIGGVEIWASF